jgi:hypothetical protein
MEKLLYLISFLCLTAIVTAQPTYNNIAPTLYKHCTECHRPGGGAPFSMLDYNSTKAWAFSMKQTLQDGEMPPWGADTSYLHFINERPISQADKDTIIAWIDGGALEGNPSMVPPPPFYPTYKLNGTPDLILNMTPFASNASTTDAYNTVVIPTGTAQIRNIRAIEIVPTNPELVHHAIVNADTSGQVSNDFSGTSYVLQGDIAVGSYAPGANPIVFPNSPQLKMGIEIPANGDLVLQIHTPAGTFGQMINIEVRLYFYPPAEPGIRQVYTFVPLQYWENDFFILPEDTQTFSTEEPTFPFDISIFSAFPHSHQICTEILNYAYDSLTNDTIPLMKINRWDFEHQEYYYYKNLVKIPAGYMYHGDHTYDNSHHNHHNPYNPPQTITVGFSSTDEMFFDGFQFITYQTGDELINVDSIFANDTLVSYAVVGIDEPQAKYDKSTSFVYPNPVKNKATIYYNYMDKHWSNYQLEVYTINGKKVPVNYVVRNGSFEIDRGNLSANIYIYQIIEKGNTVSTGKMVFE